MKLYNIASSLILEVASRNDIMDGNFIMMMMKIQEVKEEDGYKCIVMGYH